MAENDRDLLVLTRSGRDTWALVEFLVDNAKLGREIDANPDFDVVDVLFDWNRGEVQAAVYESGGLRRYHHLKPFDSEIQQWLETTFVGQSVTVTSMTLDRRWLTVLVTGPRNPGNFYVVDTTRRRTIDIGKVYPKIREEKLAEIRALSVKTTDGTSIEAFIALPGEFKGELPPLLVMPHGGPIGVRDNRSFNPEVQYLASRGFAVLTVNYRGSEGYGRAFFESGRRQWAEGIEADIDAAVDQVIEAGLVDAGRMCIAGASYGGYSALINVSRGSGRYRCAASLNGPTDILLMFDSSDFAAFEEGREGFAKTVGDPVAERERLIRISPAYRAAEIEAPVLLAQSTQDQRVDVEHFYRMKAMLEVNGKEFEEHLIEGAGHSPPQEEMIRYLIRLDGFLRRHLGL